VSGRRFAPAKVNLFLHVGPLAADGYHPLSSLMVFADVGDVLEWTASDRFELEVAGPFADHAPAGEENLVVRAVLSLCRRLGCEPPKIRLRLTKQLPAAAGLGGGSSDAPAALRVVEQALGTSLPEDLLLETAAELGSDIPACVLARPVLAEGRGERLSEPFAPFALPAVLIRPDAPSATGKVFRAYDEMGAPGGADTPSLPADLGVPQEAARLLGACRNDLEAPALALEPLIAEALELLKAQPEALLARMSGSGSACFALCADEAAARTLAGRLKASQPGWWVAPCRLGGPWP
jgi:4-diphosphocytidyl-2-C-methyl-D-erythritol kinase